MTRKSRNHMDIGYVRDDKERLYGGVSLTFRSSFRRRYTCVSLYVSPIISPCVSRSLRNHIELIAIYSRD